MATPDPFIHVPQCVLDIFTMIFTTLWKRQNKTNWGSSSPHAGLCVYPNKDQYHIPSVFNYRNKEEESVWHWWSDISDLSIYLLHADIYMLKFIWWLNHLQIWFSFQHRWTWYMTGKGKLTEVLQVTNLEWWRIWPVNWLTVFMLMIINSQETTTRNHNLYLEAECESVIPMMHSETFQRLSFPTDDFSQEDTPSAVFAKTEMSWCTRCCTPNTRFSRTQPPHPTSTNFHS